MDWTGINELHGLAQRAALAKRAEQQHKTDLEVVQIMNDTSIADPNARYMKARQRIVESLMPQEVRGGLFRNLARTVEPPPNMMSEFQRGIFSQTRAGILPQQQGVSGQTQTGISPQQQNFETPEESGDRRYRDAQARYMEGTGRQPYRRSPTADIADLEAARATLWSTLKQAGVENPDEHPRIKAYDSRIDRALNEGIPDGSSMGSEEAPPMPKTVEQNRAEANAQYGSPDDEIVPPEMVNPGNAPDFGAGISAAQRVFAAQNTPSPRGMSTASNDPNDITVQPQRGIGGGIATGKISPDYIGMAREMGADNNDIADLQAIFDSGDQATIQEAIRRLTQGK